MRATIRKYGAGTLAVVLTLTVVVISMGIAFLTQWGTGRNEAYWFGLVLAGVIPLITATTWQKIPEPAPDWWPVSPSEVSKHFRTYAKRGSTRRFCRSAGGRDVWVYELSN